MSAPQIIVGTLLAISVGIALAKYGEPKRDRFDIIDVFSPIAFGALLWWGGFFG